jgi:hypothetical protein
MLLAVYTLMVEEKRDKIIGLVFKDSIEALWKLSPAVAPAISVHRNSTDLQTDKRVLPFVETNAQR